MNDEKIREIMFPKKAIHQPQYEQFVQLLKEMACRGHGRWFDMRSPDFILVGCTEQEAIALTNRFIL